MDNQIEQQRNRLLRRADWRFLLDNPWPEKSICLNRGFLAQAVQAVSSKDITGEKDFPGEFDLVVARNPNSTALQKAWLALRSSGSFYSEWYSPMVGGTAGIRKRLEAAGFTDVVCYWPWPIPTFSPALFWLPLDAPQAVRYFLSNRSQPTSLLAHFASSLLQILWKFFRKTHLLVPVCVTARKSDPVAVPIFQDNPEEDILTHWGNVKSAGKPRRFNAFMWTGGKRSINKVILYQFANGEEIPQRIVKLPRTPETVPALIHEAHILQALHARKSEAATRAPAVLFLHELNGMVALEETTVLGRPLYTVLNKENTLGLVIKVTDWLSSLAVGEPLVPREVWWDRLVEPALHDFEQAFGAMLDRSVLPKCRMILNRLGALPQVFEHRDCSPWNLLVTTSGELAVLDWESAEQDGLPALDLVYFLTYLAFFIDGSIKNGKFIESYRRASDPATFTGSVKVASLVRYIECTGLDSGILQPLRLLAWLIHSRSEIRHLSADTGGSPQPAALQHSLFYNLVLEELAIEQSPAQASTH